jgi:tetratricopeptide (TPR) repeat protein
MLNVQQTYRMGLVHLEAKRLADAESCFRVAVASEPGFAAGHYHLGLVLRLRKQWRGAAQSFRAAIRVAPAMARAHAGLGSVLDRIGQLDEAEAQLRQAIVLDPQLKEAGLFLGELLRSRLALTESRAVYEAMLAGFPDDPDARFGRAFLRLLEGDLASGWNDYEFRPARRGRPDPALMPQWRGEDPANRTILLYAEQGIGDTIQFLRYATVLANKGARVLAAVPIPVMELATRVEGVHEVLTPGPSLPRFDFCVPLPSLPLYCGTTVDSIPWSGAYLCPPPLAQPPDLPPNDEAILTVALAWAGNPDHPDDHNRSLPVAEVEPLLELPNIRWLILQKGSGASKLDSRDNVIQLGDRLNNFSDIAAVICKADLTISVDTSFCHLAGALGRPVWTLLSRAPDWRWLLGRADSPWYPTMRLFRQSAQRDWAGVIAAVSEALADLREEYVGQRAG